MTTFTDFLNENTLEEWHKGSHTFTKNSDGTPKIFFHGSNSDFDVFDINKTKSGNFGKGFYFTYHIDKVNDHWATGENANIMPVYIKTLKPFDTRVINQELIEKFLNEINQPERIRDQRNNRNPVNYYKTLMGSSDGKFVPFLLKEGYDALIGTSPAVGEQIVVYRSNQIKSKFNKSFTSSQRITEYNEFCERVFKGLKTNITKETKPITYEELKQMVKDKNINGLSSANTSEITTLSSLFENTDFGSEDFNPDLSGWDTSKVMSFKNLFSDCVKLVTPPDISDWDVSNAESMVDMFGGCYNLEKAPDLSKWKTPNLKYARFMFAECKKMEPADFSNLDFRRVQNTGSVFEYCKEMIAYPQGYKPKGELF